MNHYIYVYLDPRKKGKYNYNGLEFEFEPFYLGVSKNESRKFTHLDGAKKYLMDGKVHVRYRNNRKIYKIAKIINEGFEPIILIYKNDLTEEEAYNLEKEYVSKIGRLRNDEGPLLNYLPGGQIIDGDLISIQLRKNKELNQDKAKKVLQFNATGILIKVWDSVEKAKMTTKVTHVGQCCRGECKTAGGFVWKYENSNIIKRKKYKERKTNNVRNKREIVQYDLNNNKIAEYPSIFEASSKTKIERTAIGNNLSGKTKKSGGYIWKYKQN